MDFLIYVSIAFYRCTCRCLVQEGQYVRAGEEETLILSRTRLLEDWQLAHLDLAAKPISDERKRSFLEQFSAIDAEFKSIDALQAFIGVISRFEHEVSERVRVHTLKARPLVPRSHEDSRITPVVSAVSLLRSLPGSAEHTGVGPLQNQRGASVMCAASRLLLSSLPDNTCEPSVLKLVESPDLAGSSSLLCRLFAPSPPTPSDLSVVGVPTNVMPGYPFEFFVVRSDGYPTLSPEEAAVFSAGVSSRLCISMTLPDVEACQWAGFQKPVALVRALAGDCGVRVTVPSLWTTPGPIMTLDSVALAGMQGAVPGAPKAIRVGANHDTASAGRRGVWRAAFNGNAIGVLAALCDGCSTEESEDVSTSRPTQCFFGMCHGFELGDEMDEIEDCGKPKKPPPKPYEPYVRDPRCDYQVALIAAAKQGHLDVVRVLVNAGADTSAVYPYEVS